MKAVLNLAVEIDLSQIICDDSLEALMLFTGTDSVEGVGAFYLEKVASTLRNQKELNMPHVKYQISGDIIPSENLLENIQQAEDSVEKPVSIEDYHMIDEGESESVPVNEEQEYLDDEEASKVFVDKILEFMESVSIGKGLPKEIRISAEHYDFACVKDEAGISSIGGLPVVRDNSLEVIAEIDYEPYGSMGEVETAYLRSLGQVF